MANLSSWWGRCHEERTGRGTIRQPPPEPEICNPAIAPPGGITRSEPNPITGKPLRPGERLERQARKYATLKSHAILATQKSHAILATEEKPVQKRHRKRRDYDAMIARALEDLDL